jgi:UPF0271 protein
MNIDLNCDMGEGYGRYEIGNDQEIMPLISSSNIACGFHAGDPIKIDQTLRMALDHDVKIGAHPSYPDLQGFGRRSMKMSLTELNASMAYQICAVKGMAEMHGAQLHHVKPHGALYNDSSKDEALTRIIYTTIAGIDSQLLIFGLPGSAHEYVANEMGMEFWAEGFADRLYDPDGHLLSRGEEGALITDPKLASDQVRLLVEKDQVVTSDGSTLSLKVQTICVHGDNPSVLAILEAIHPSMLLPSNQPNLE